MMLGQPVSKESQEIIGTSRVFSWGKHGCMPCCHVHEVHSPIPPTPAFSIRPQQQQKMVMFLWWWCFVLFFFVFAGLLRFPISYSVFLFMTQFQILKAVQVLSIFHEFFRIQFRPMIMH